MEIRKNINFTMEESEESTDQKNVQDERILPPNSPCESEISVGCEAETCTDPQNSPMDIAEEDASGDEKLQTNEANIHFVPISRASSQSPRSTHSLSPASTVEGDESSCFSEEEYFRPLKRLAMCESSPQESPVVQNHHSVPTTSSPEPLPLPISSESQQKSNTYPQKSNDNDKSLRRLQEAFNNRANAGVNDQEDLEMDLREDRAPPGDQKLSGLRSFSILDILSYKPSRRKSSIPVKIVRPWDTREETSKSNSVSLHPPSKENKEVNKSSRNNNNNNTSVGNNNAKKQSGQNNDRGSALDALFKMTNKTLDNLNKEDKADAVNLFNNRQQTKKKRKSRTAFTNNQIFELEKRFLYQKYLSPADRDELAQSLGLSNAQVITWFQNRRAKLKRDMEELKRDVECTKTIPSKALLEAASANVVAFLKAKDLPKIHLASLHH